MEVIIDFDTKDFPDFTDAYIVSAFKDGVELSEEEVEILNKDRDFVYECVMEKIF